jgi:hypothetical protein
MKHLQFATLAIFCLSTSAWAQGAPNTDASSQWRARHNVFDGSIPGGLVPNGNQCAPEYPQPVLGPNSQLLGYSCSNFANGR